MSNCFESFSLTDVEKAPTLYILIPVRHNIQAIRLNSRHHFNIAHVIPSIVSLLRTTLFIILYYSIFINAFYSSEQQLEVF